VTTTRQDKTWKKIAAGAVLISFVAYCAAHVLKLAALERVFDAVIVVFGVLLYATLISLPGIGIAYFTWKLSRNMKPMIARVTLRAGVFAIAITPAFWGHAGFVPAIILAFVLHGRDRLNVFMEIAAVWAVAIPVLFLRARNQ
jgi:hypothetical protein